MGFGHCAYCGNPWDGHGTACKQPGPPSWSPDYRRGDVGRFPKPIEDVPTAVDAELKRMKAALEDARLSEKSAFYRGAEAMRLACIEAIYNADVRNVPYQGDDGQATLHNAVKDVKAIPLPEYAP